MKLSLIFIMLSVSLLFTGPDTPLNGALTKPRAELPQWVVVPLNFEVATIDYRGNTASRSRRGTAVMTGFAPPVETLSELESAFAGAGFETLAGELGPANAETRRGFVKAIDLANGRSAVFILTSGTSVSQLEVSFRDAPNAPVSGVN